MRIIAGFCASIKRALHVHLTKFCLWIPVDSDIGLSVFRCNVDVLVNATAARSWLVLFIPERGAVVALLLRGIRATELVVIRSRRRRLPVRLLVYHNPRVTSTWLVLVVVFQLRHTVTVLNHVGRCSRRDDFRAGAIFRGNDLLGQVNVPSERAVHTCGFCSLSVDPWEIGHWPLDKSHPRLVNWKTANAPKYLGFQSVVPQRHVRLQCDWLTQLRPVAVGDDPPSANVPHLAGGKQWFLAYQPVDEGGSNRPTQDVETIHADIALGVRVEAVLASLARKRPFDLKSHIIFATLTQ